MATNQIVEEHSDQEGRENGMLSEASENKLSSNGERKRKCSKGPPGKPPYSYVALITMAITSIPCHKMTLGEISTYIADNFTYYKA